MQESEKSHKVLFPIGRPGVGSAGKTSSWRTSRPEINLDLCVKCGQCWTFCPEGVIDVNNDGYPVIDYEYCKGCLICQDVCPKEGCIVEIPEA